MKANAPEKIYIHVKNGKTLNTWNNVWIGVNDVEYIRTDAFIKKVINFLNYKLDYVVATQVPGTIIPHHVAKQELIEDFRKYMEGE